MSRGLETCVSYLDNYLRIADIPDEPEAVNGLQVENSGSVHKVVAAVDACQATIDAAAGLDADMLLVHHGLFWARDRALVGRHGRRIRSLLSNDIAVYSAHVPLDVHPEVGNNAVLAADLGVADPRPFGDYRGIEIGLAGELSVTRDDLAARLAEITGRTPHIMPCGPDGIRRVGIVTGGAGSMILQAKRAGLDAFITGEGQHYTHFDAEESGINVFYAGHYATETFGVKALAARLADEFGVTWEFVDHPTGL